MRWRAEVRVTFRDGIADPEGTTVLGGLRALGFGEVADVRAGKLLVLTLEAADRERARARVDEACRRLLANPVMERYEFDVAPVADAETDAA